MGEFDLIKRYFERPQNNPSVMIAHWFLFRLIANWRLPPIL